MKKLYTITLLAAAIFGRLELGIGMGNALGADGDVTFARILRRNGIAIMGHPFFVHPLQYLATRLAFACGMNGGGEYEQNRDAG